MCPESAARSEARGLWNPVLPSSWDTGPLSSALWAAGEPVWGALTVHLELQELGPGPTARVHQQHREVAAVSGLQRLELQAEVAVELGSAQEAGAVQSLCGAPEKRGQELLRRPERSPDGLSDLEAGRALCCQQHRAPDLAVHLGAGGSGGKQCCKKRTPSLPAPSSSPVSRHRLRSQLSCCEARWGPSPHTPSTHAEQGALCGGLGIKA